MAGCPERVIPGVDRGSQISPCSAEDFLIQSRPQVVMQTFEPAAKRQVSRGLPCVEPCATGLELILQVGGVEGRSGVVAEVASASHISWISDCQ